MQIINNCNYPKILKENPGDQNSEESHCTRVGKESASQCYSFFLFTLAKL